ncbi:hypothetical protein LXA43DRAFT_1121938 [Ganoderma leucocontextum]|nr:hypothetical protein LXA43DRAFT_1121938 [Ganoderma leucocontextum]
MNNHIQAHQPAPSNDPASSGTGPRQHVTVDFDSLETRSHQAALQDGEHNVNELRKREQEAAHRAHSLRTSLAEANRRADADRIAFEQWAQQADRRVSEAEHRAKSAEADAAQLSRELQQAKGDLQTKAALLETRSAELSDAQAYLTKLDDVPDTEIVQLVGGINSSIYQAAASIADAFRSRFGGQKNMQVSQEAAASLQGLLDNDLLRALCSLDHADDPFVVQTVLQAAMVSYTGRLCATWDFHVGDPPCLLQEVYHVIRRTEQQSVAGRWRALGRTYLKVFRADDADRQRVASDALLEHITDILLASGITMPRRDLRIEVERSYANILGDVVLQSYELQSIAGERIISRDLMMVTVNPGEPFDPSRMVDEWADPKGAGRRVDIYPVLCTTQLGLVREERKATGGAGGEEGISKVVLLKPNVVLTSFLQELWNEKGRKL